MSALKYWWLGAVIAAAVVACVVIDHRSRRELAAQESELRKQSAQLSELEEQSVRSSNMPNQAAENGQSNQTEELAVLRSEAESLRKQSNELAQAAAMAKRKIPEEGKDGAGSPPVLPENHDQEMQVSYQMRDAGVAILMFVGDHKNQVPASKEELAKYFPKTDHSPPDPNSYDLIFQGSLDDLKGIPTGTVAVTRSRQVWQRPDGKLVRDYGFLDGHSQTVSADDNFKAFEAEHVIKPPQKGVTGR